LTLLISSQKIFKKFAEVKMNTDHLENILLGLKEKMGKPCYLLSEAPLIEEQQLSSLSMG